MKKTIKYEYKNLDEALKNAALIINQKKLIEKENLGGQRKVFMNVLSKYKKQANLTIVNCNFNYICSKTVEVYKNTNTEKYELIATTINDKVIFDFDENIALVYCCARTINAKEFEKIQDLSKENRTSALLFALKCCGFEFYEEKINEEEAN